MKIKLWALLLTVCMLSACGGDTAQNNDTQTDATPVDGGGSPGDGDATRRSDTTAPAFPADAVLTVADVTATAALVSWPEAADDVGVSHYAVTLDGAPLDPIAADVTEANLTALVGGRAYLVTVRALDAAGNLSDELTTTVRTPDDQAPQWPNPRLTVRADVTEASLSWSEATDNLAVVAYRVYQNDVQVSETTERQLSVESLSPSTEYTFRVEAGDAAGNWSADGPVQQVTTEAAYDPGFKRLTQVQYTYTIADLFGQLWADRYARRAALGLDPGQAEHGSGAAYHERLTGQSWGYPQQFRNGYPQDSVVPGPDTPRGGFSRLDSVVYDEHAAAWVGVVMYLSDFWSGWIGAQAVLEPCRYEYRNDLRQADTLAAAYRQCAIELIDEFAPRALRRPMSPEERASFIAAYDEIPMVYAADGLDENEVLVTGVGHLLAIIALQPEVSYHVELGDEAGDLTAYELANRLSYHFWNTIHDINEQDAPGGHNSRVAYHSGPNGEAGPIPVWNNTGGANSFVREALQSELLNLGRYFTRINPGTFEGMFRSNDHLMSCQPPPWADPSECTGTGPWAQAIYGINGRCADFDSCAQTGWTDAEIGWDGVSEPIQLPEPERVGLITRMAFLGHDTYQARPIRRGLLIREMLLCDPIPPPENCDVVQPPSLTGKCTDANGAESTDCTGDSQCDEGQTCVGWDRPVAMTVRERVEALTEQPGSSCAQCHSTLINGFGHALGHFSSLGKYWETEHMFSDQRNAEEEFWFFGATPDRWRPIDTASSTILNGNIVEFDGAQEVADLLVESGRMEWCWSREYFRYSMGRHEFDTDAQAIEDMAQALRDGQTLDVAFQSIAHLPQFKILAKPPTRPIEGGE